MTKTRGFFTRDDSRLFSSVLKLFFAKNLGEMMQTEVDEAHLVTKWYANNNIIAQLCFYILVSAGKKTSGVNLPT